MRDEEGEERPMKGIAQTMCNGICEDLQPMLRPLTPSSAPSTSRSPSRRARVIGRNTGLDKPIWARRVGLDIALAVPKLWRALKYELEPCTMGEEAPEWTPFGMGIGIGMVRRGAPLPIRRCETDGETARRFAAVG